MSSPWVPEMAGKLFDNTWIIAAIWIGMALAASLISIKIGITVALVEVFMGILAGNFLGIQETTEWIDFLAVMGSMSIAFLAGAELDPQSFKRNLKPSIILGVLSFLLPFLGVWVFTQHVLGWDFHQSQIAGIALSTTSVAVVYAAIVDKGLSDTKFGKLVLSVCFVTDLGSVFLLSVLFVPFNLYMLLLLAAIALAIFVAPPLVRFTIRKLGTNKVSEPVIKLLLLILFLLAGLAFAAGIEAVLPAFVFGIIVAGVFVKDKVLINRIRTLVFTVFTPFLFIKAGLLISVNAAIASLGLIAIFLLLKVILKTAAIFPASRAFKIPAKMSGYSSLLMSTGIAFGTIAAMYGFNHQIIDQTQYTVLVTVVILSAIIPALIAQVAFEPSLEEAQSWGKVQEKNTVLEKPDPPEDCA